MLKKIDAITLGAKISQSETMPPNCELVINEEPTGHRVDGYWLEAAYQYSNGYLVFLSHDCPFEETLSIYLLDFCGAVKDSAHIGGMYTTGCFRAVEIKQPAEIVFEFFAEATWVAQLLPKPTFRIPFFFEPMCVSRPFGFHRYFLLRKHRAKRIASPSICF